MSYYLDVDTNDGDVDIRVGRRRVARPLPIGDTPVPGSFAGFLTVGAVALAGLFYWAVRR